MNLLMKPVSLVLHFMGNDFFLQRAITQAIGLSFLQ